MKAKIFVITIFMIILSSCLNKKVDKIDNLDQINHVESAVKSEILTKGDSIIQKVIEAHGGELFENANYTFTFRGKTYQFQNDKKNYIYSVETKRNDSIIKDVLTNENFKRYINNVLQKLNDEEVKKYSEAINSVIYFATLPYKLNDASVNKKFIEERTIKNKKYDVIEVTFNPEGGGKDHEDEFYYWINKQTNKIDYIAYNYKVNEGGVRFREAFNTRVVDGITFQDYVNYEAPLGTPLKQLPVLFQEDKLKELSKILTEDVTNNK